MRNAALALLDMAWHDGDPTVIGSVPEFERSAMARTQVLPPVPEANTSSGFGHIFGGGYAAGYYSYKWAEVLSADAYSFFEEKGVLNPDAGARFRDEILAVGGSRPAAESFRAFRGREPSVDALLRHNGMVAA